MGLLLFAVLHVLRAQQAPPPPPTIEPARALFGKTVAGSGIVEARSQNIAIGAPLPGVILEVYGPQKPGLSPWDALVGEAVQKGDKLFLVDNRQLLAQRHYYEANLAYAEAQLKKLELQPRSEEKAVGKAKMDVAAAGFALQKDLSDRARRLSTTAR